MIALAGCGSKEKAPATNQGNTVVSDVYGRYGYDELSKLLSIVSLVLLIFSFLLPILLLPAWGLMLWCTYRAFSKKIEKRRKERDVYLRFLGKRKKKSLLRKNKKRDRKTHRFFKCKKCKAVLRVPKGKGSITITCPKCQNLFNKKT